MALAVVLKPSATSSVYRGMPRWLKALLPLGVLVLSLALIFLAFVEAGGPSAPALRGAPDLTGCFGDRDCERTYRQEREARP